MSRFQVVPEPWSSTYFIIKEANSGRVMKWGLRLEEAHRICKKWNADSSHKKCNARFWVYWNDSLVKVTLKPGQEIQMHCGGTTEEGYSSEYVVFEYDEAEQIVHRRGGTIAKDCDGPIESHYLDVCPVQALAQGNENYDGVEDSNGNIIRFPAWQSVNSWQCDHFAEAAGY